MTQHIANSLFPQNYQQIKTQQFVRYGCNRSFEF